MSAAHKKNRTSYQKGVTAERAAGVYLRLKGFKILKTRYKTPYGEIDLLALKGRTLAAVEVKTRGGEAEALEAITPRNRKRVENALHYFLAAQPEFSDYFMRFDVIVLSPRFGIRHLDNAWLPES